MHAIPCRFDWPLLAEKERLLIDFGFLVPSKTASLRESKFLEKQALFEVSTLQPAPFWAEVYCGFVAKGR